jgi:hypothetical protein
MIVHGGGSVAVRSGTVVPAIGLLLWFQPIVLGASLNVGGCSAWTEDSTGCVVKELLGIG